MNVIECTTQTPWGVHLAARNGEACPRCGWTAPGPLHDSAAHDDNESSEVADSG